MKMNIMIALLYVRSGLTLKHQVVIILCYFCYSYKQFLNAAMNFKDCQVHLQLCMRGIDIIFDQVYISTTFCEYCKKN